MDIKNSRNLLKIKLIKNVLIAVINNKIDSSPADWASMNNGIYLCLSCAGEHRGFGVNISYIRSITIDSWNNNQVAFMKQGGNRRLEDLAKIFEIDIKKVNKKDFYNSRLMDFYRKLIKSEISNVKTNLALPSKEECMKSLNTNLLMAKSISDTSHKKVVKNKYNCTSVTLNDNDNKQTEDLNFVYSFSNWFTSNYTSIPNQILNTTGGYIATTSGTFLDKGTESMV